MYTLTQTFTNAAGMGDVEKLAYAYVKDVDAAVLRCRTRIHQLAYAACNNAKLIESFNEELGHLISVPEQVCNVCSMKLCVTTTVWCRPVAAQQDLVWGPQPAIVRPPVCTEVW